MITEFILGAFKGIVKFLFGWLPSIPSIPGTVIDGIDSFLDSVAGVVGVISYLYTPAVFTSIFLVLIAVLLFDPLHKFALWVWHKMRG